MSIYLYRLDVVAQDDVLINRLSPAARELHAVVHTLTNAEEEQTFATEPFSSALLPPNSTSPAGGWVFKPTAIEHSELRLDGEESSGELSLSLPLMHQVCRVYRDDPAGVKVWLTLAIQDSPSTAPRVLWTGQCSKAVYEESRCKLTFTHLLSLLHRPVLTAKHPRSCPYAVYDERTCGVRPSLIDSATGYFAYREDAFITEISERGTVLKVAEAGNRPAGFFNQGFLVIEGRYSMRTGDYDSFVPRAQISVQSADHLSTVDAGYRRSVATHNGEVISLMTPLPASVSASEEAPLRVSIYAGCNALPNTCKNKFSNYSRFGGYPLLPAENLLKKGLKSPPILD